MKVFKVADIKKMGLTEPEYFMISSEIESLNKDNKSDAFAVYFFDCYHFVNSDVENAIKKIVIFLAKKCQAEYTQCSLRGACSYISNILNCSYNNVFRLLKGISYNNQHVYVADTFGLDVLSIDND